MEASSASAPVARAGLEGGGPVPVSFVVSHGRLGGAERYVELLLRELGGDWVQGIVCLSDGPFVDRLRQLKWVVEVERTPRRVGMLPAAWRLRRRLLRQRPQVVHANGTKAALVCALATVGTGFPVIWVKHDHFRDGWLANAIAWRCREVIGVSETVNATFRGRLRERLAVVPNGIPDVAVDRDAARRLVAGLVGAERGAPVVALVGRLDPLKGGGELLEAAPGILGRLPGARFAFVGGDEAHHPGYRAALERRAGELGIGRSVAFLGHRDDAIEIVAGADVVVIPSIPGSDGMGKEGCPLVAIEALWVGTPVVGYADGALPEVVGGVSRLVAPGDRAGLARAIVDVVEDPALRERLVRDGMARAWRRHRFASVVAVMREHYRSAARDAGQVAA